MARSDFFFSLLDLCRDGLFGKERRRGDGEEDEIKKKVARWVRLSDETKKKVVRWIGSVILSMGKKKKKKKAGEREIRVGMSD